MRTKTEKNKINWFEITALVVCLVADLILTIAMIRITLGTNVLLYEPSKIISLLEVIMGLFAGIYLAIMITKRFHVKK